MMRIDRFVRVLAEGDVPPDLAAAFPKGVLAAQKAHLESAKKRLDQLTCTTIHGFAQLLIKPYPVEADIDPGAEIVDPAEADLAFEERYLAWLKGHLSGEVNDGIVAELVLADERGALALIRNVADFLRQNRDSRPIAAQWSNAAIKKFVKAVAAFEKEIGRFDFRDDGTEDACRAFVELADLAKGCGLGAERPGNRSLLEAINLPRHEACFRKDGAKRSLAKKGAWEKAAAAIGRSKAEGTQAYDAVNSIRRPCAQDSHETFENTDGLAGYPTGLNCRDRASSSARSITYPAAHPPTPAHLQDARAKIHQ
jgi:exodeoxyribonuclease-5